MRLACPTCKASLKVSRIKRHCFEEHRYTDMMWRKFLIRQGSQTLVNLLENPPLPSKEHSNPPSKVAPSPPDASNESQGLGSASARTMTEPTMAELKARIAKLERKAERSRRIENSRSQSQRRRRQKLTNSAKAKRRAAAKAQQRFKARFRVARGSSPGVPRARIVSGGRVESKR